MKDLEKILGKTSIKKIEKKSKYILRETYKKDAQEGPEGRIDIKEHDAITKTTVEILENFGLITYAGHWRAGTLGTYKITEKGKLLFDTHFRKKREYFNIFEKLEHTLQE